MFKDDPTIGIYEIGAVGIEVWQATSGSIFDSITISNEESYFTSIAKKWKSDGLMKEVEEIKRIEIEKSREIAKQSKLGKKLEEEKDEL